MAFWLIEKKWEQFNMAGMGSGFGNVATQVSSAEVKKLLTAAKQDDNAEESQKL